MAKCRYCGRPLKDPVSIARGAGAVCARKHGLEVVSITEDRSGKRVRLSVRTIQRGPAPEIMNADQLNLFPQMEGVRV